MLKADSATSLGMVYKHGHCSSNQCVDLTRIVFFASVSSHPIQPEVWVYKSIHTQITPVDQSTTVRELDPGSLPLPTSSSQIGL